MRRRRLATPDATVYNSSLPWNPERPDTTIITCVDGRWYHHFQEFARMHLNAGARTDFLAVPGGIEPLTLLDLVPKDFNFFRRRIEALVEAHGTRRFVAIAHEDCAWYRTRAVGPVARYPIASDRGPAEVGGQTARDVRRRDGRDVLRPSERRHAKTGDIRDGMKLRLSAVSSQLSVIRGRFKWAKPKLIADS